MGVVVGAKQGHIRQRSFCVVGWSGSGKTTLIERLIPLLPGRVGYLKGHNGAFDMDREGKDTDRAYRAGADRVAIASPTEGALRFRLEARDPIQLLEEHFADCDLVVLEGFKSSPLPKLEVIAEKSVNAHMAIAIVSDAPDPRDLPRFARDDVQAIARFVETTLLG